MRALPARLILYVVVPTLVGSALAWTTRPGHSAPEAGRAARSGTAAPGASGEGVVAAAKATRTRFDSPLTDQRRFCDRLRGASFEQMEDLLTEAQTFADAFRRRSARELVFEQMARIDPTRGWTFITTWERGTYRNQFLNAWGRVDAAGALAWAETQGDAAKGHTQSIIAGLVPDDIQGFAKILPRLKPEHVRDDQLATAFRLLSVEDPSQAVKFLEGLDKANGSQRNSAASSLAEGWARRDAPGAYAWATNLKDPAQRESALRGVFRAWAETDPKGVAAKLDQLSNEGAVTKDARGESPTRAIVRAWAAQDPKAAAAWLRDRIVEDGSNSFRDLFSSEILPTRDEWAATDIADMLRKPGEKLVTDQKNIPFNHSMSWSDQDGTMISVLGQFGGYNSPLRGNGYPGDPNQSLRLSNPEQAWDELAKQPADAPRQHLLHEVASLMVEKDPQAAMAKLQQTTDDWLRLGLVNALSARARQTRDPALAATIAETFPKEQSWQSRSMISEIYADIANREPERARTLLAGELDDSSKANIASALASAQATYDPAGAIAWAAEQPDENLQRTATQSAVSGWAQADAFAASEWLAAQPAGPLREAAVAGLIGALSYNSPDDALEWAATLTDPQQRQSQQMNIVQNLIWRDIQRAKVLAADLSLPEPMRKSLDQMIENREKQGGY